MRECRLINEKREKHEEMFEKSLLELYKLFVGTSLDITSKRLESNKFHLALSSFIFGLASYLTVLNQHAVILLLSSIGILISFVWRRSILAYKELNKAKFKVIHELEDYLPAAVFKFEEKCYLGKYHGLTGAEKFYPIIFLILYASLIIFVIANTIGII